jgi:hypothetical protein
MNLQEFGQRVKQKYPQYKNIDDVELANKIIEKYPIYRNRITDESLPSTSTTNAVDQQIEPTIKEEKKVGLAERVGKFLGKSYQGLLKGAAKGVLSTAKGTSSLGERLIERPIERVTGLRMPGQTPQTAAEQFLPETLTRPEGVTENIGFGAEQIAEFFVSGDPASKLSKAITYGGKGAGLLKAGVKAGTEFLITGGQRAIQKGKVDDDVKTTALVSGLFSWAGSGLSGLKKSLRPIGEKIQVATIKPSAQDFADGFNVQNITKYGVGGSLEESAVKTHIKLNTLIKKLKSNNQASSVVVNLNNVVDDTTKELLSISKSKQFGNIAAIKRVLDGLKSEVQEVSGPNGLVDLIDATNVKRGAGIKGAWSFGRIEPDATATEKVYSTFYRKLKELINKVSPASTQEINKQISELIPISNAIIRRIPIDARNNVIGLTDSIGLFSAMFDPKALALIGASRLSKSGKFGQWLVNVANSVPKSTIGKRIFGY